MKLQESIPLSSVYTREEDFSEELADMLADRLDVLKVGRFGDEVKTESPVGLHRADIVASGEDGTLVVENQFGEANWDHWGRLEAYARLKEANVAALVAERFKDLMIETCMLRNEESAIDWGTQSQQCRLLCSINIQWGGQDATERRDAGTLLRVRVLLRMHRITHRGPHEIPRS